VVRDQGDPQLTNGKSGLRPGGIRAVQALVAVVLALAAAAGVDIAMKKLLHHHQAATAAAAVAGPAAYHNGYLRLGNPNGKVVIQITEDFACPACGSFEAASGPTIAKLIGDGAVAVEYRPIALIDRNYSGQTTYSARSAGAAACVADADVTKWLAFHTALFHAQPSEGTAGPTDQQLAQSAQQAGVTAPSAAGCITSGQYLQFANATTDTALTQIQGTPTILVNGTQLSDFTPDGILAAVAKAQAR
jgi:protein-disulfide isomerase